VKKGQRKTRGWGKESRVEGEGGAQGLEKELKGRDFNEKESGGKTDAAESGGLFGLSLPRKEWGSRTENLQS